MKYTKIHKIYQTSWNISQFMKNTNTYEDSEISENQLIYTAEWYK
jgi:hypothetical protein